jgi:hypothetical protein
VHVFGSPATAVLLDAAIALPTSPSYPVAFDATSRARSVHVLPSKRKW